MYINRVQVRNFRCLSECSVTFDAPITLVYGGNGTGKTSLLEALYYAAYLRSFRTPHPREMIAFDTDAFTIGIDGVSYEQDASQDAWHLHIGCSHDKRVVRKNRNNIASYKQLLTFYRVLHIIEDDMEIIKGTPKSRRSFIDQSLLLYDYAYAYLMRSYKKALSQRSSLVAHGKTNDTIWLQQMWSYAYNIVTQRMQWLEDVEHEANTLLADFFPETQIRMIYKPKYPLYHTFDAFYAMYQEKIEPQESFSNRVKFGPHLDDVDIYLHNNVTRTYASRGQQKLVMVILKLAAIRLVNQPILLLVDDMFSDFDSTIIHNILTMLAHRSHQIIMTAPGLQPHIEHALKTHHYHTVSISK